MHYHNEVEIIGAFMIQALIIMCLYAQKQQNNVAVHIVTASISNRSIDFGTLICQWIVAFEMSMK